MYKLFLCLRYLYTRVIAYFAMLAVMLCVAMMLIVISVMDGFLHKIEVAAKGLFGDIVVEGSGLSGIARYDEFITEAKQKVPEIQEGSPFILSYGLLSKPNTEYRQAVQIAGIRLPERTRVSDFGHGLFVQAGMKDPTFDPPLDLVRKRLDDLAKDTQQWAADAQKAKKDPERNRLLARDLDYYASMYETVAADLHRYQKAAGLLNKLPKEQATSAMASLQESASPDGLNVMVRPPEHHCILGLGIPGMAFRTAKGETIRNYVPGQYIVLTVVPLGRGSASGMEYKPQNEPFTVVDDCKTGVSSIDSAFVYVPFETLQRLNNMGPETIIDEQTGKPLMRRDPQTGREEPATTPGRCSQIHIRVRPEFSNDQQLPAIAERIQDVWDSFVKTHPDATTDYGRGGVTVRTWRQQQAALVGQIAAQRTLSAIIVGIMCIVAVVLIFVIFYMIVLQKTRDIGIIKSVGGSSIGVAGLFLTYGGAIGLVGSLFGVILGWIFVQNINPIHDWVGDTFGFKVWNREWFMFDKIPSEVEPSTVAFIVVAAIAAGVVGALIPAVRAARMQPVRALRYE